MKKHCTKCGVEYPRTRESFPLDKRCKDGLGSQCRKCANTATAAWRTRGNYNAEYYQKNKERESNRIRKYGKTFRGFVVRLLVNIKTRCTNPKATGYKYYGGRGIKCCFTADELCVWLVFNKIDPRGLEIHRINNDENYTLDNIVFVSNSEHKQLHNAGRKGE